MKDAWKKQKDCSNTSTGFIVQEGALQMGDTSHLKTWSRYRGVV
jgi:hypothetical protein